MSTQERRARSLFGTGRARWLATPVDALSRRCPFSSLSLALGTTLATNLGSALFLGRRASALEKQTQLVHEELERRHVLPRTHVVDAGYVDAGAIVESREVSGVALVGPVSKNHQWQAKA